MSDVLGKRQPNAFGTGTAFTGKAPLRSTAGRKPKSTDRSWWAVAEADFADVAAAERERLANIESPPVRDKWEKR